MTFWLLQLDCSLGVLKHSDFQISIKLLREKRKIKPAVDDSNNCKLGLLKVNGVGVGEWGRGSSFWRDMCHSFASHQLKKKYQVTCGHK